MSITAQVLTSLGILLLGVIAMTPGVWSMHRRAAYWRAQALTDPLTELPNRRALTAHLRQRHEDRAPTAILLLDVDGLKAVNTGYGHGAGDALLQALAARLQHLGPVPVDLAARLGGDEFAVVVHTGDPRQAHRVAEAVHAAVTGTPVSLGTDLWVDLGLSIGVAVGTAYSHPPLLLHQADLAMYEAKAAGGGVHLHGPAAVPTTCVDRRPLVRPRDRHRPAERGGRRW
ncbi:hypothetical protein GCM10010124_31590 [Pilimelia terevasa]|uniref:GGDEF domain-containing protein n=1 Tax=Pilimelia terevasa TaxID=53372 RepID=A0A8J3BPI1_9ACTN|nr:GGDEF domain-containing protein [Pilimelia terevasa]GGK36611.1 hypothetical protein GCM10010124_31590 [Pilimelia terevasa]